MTELLQTNYGPLTERQVDMLRSRGQPVRRASDTRRPVSLLTQIITGQLRLTPDALKKVLSAGTL